MEAAADVDNAAFAHVTPACLCAQRWGTLGCAEQDWGWLLHKGRDVQHAQMQMESSRYQWAVCFIPAPQKLSKLFSALRRILGAFHSFLRGKGGMWQLSSRMVTALICAESISDDPSFDSPQGFQSPCHHT